MSKYRILVSRDEKNWIVVDNEKLIKNPTGVDLKETKFKSYNNTNICDKCREQNKITDKSILYPGNACRKKDDKGNWNGNWNCKLCYEKYDNDSNHNTIKSMRSRRTGNLNVVINSVIKEKT